MQLKRFPFPLFRAGVLALALATAFAALMRAQQGCVPPPPGMVSWWPGDGNAQDIIGSNNGTLQGGTTFAPGKVAQAFSFNGTDAYVDVPNPSNNLNPGTSDFTVDFWINTSSRPNLVEYLLTKRDVCSLTSFWSIQMQASGTVTAELGQDSSFTNYNAIFGTIVVNDGQWHHVALVRQSFTATLYIDGVMNSSNSTFGITNIFNSSDVLFANSPCVPGNGSQLYRGLIDEVEYFNRAVSPAEIAGIVAAGSAGKCKPEAPVTATGAMFGATEGVTFTGTVATFTDSDPTSTAAEYSATIDWGDTTPTTPGTISGPTGGPFTVSGAHMYAEQGTYTVMVAITDIDNSKNNATVASTARVSDARLSSTCATMAVSTQNYSGSTATFTDQSSTGSLSDFSATIFWGDNSSSPGAITGGSGNVPYVVNGTHAYASTGTFMITTTITDVDGSSTTTPACSVTIFTFATGKGAAFVIGDLEAGLGNHVTWWSSQWAKINLMSGGAPPNSMKGFAGFEDNFLGLPPANCGGTWSTDTGNSTPPPPSVPKFMGVIVSSMVTQSGSVITGNIKQVVVVQTDPGYAPNQGSPGTGTEIAIVCSLP